MKTNILSVAALSLLQLAAAQPHARHFHKHAQRDLFVETDVIIVDPNGKIISTSVQGYVLHTDAVKAVSATPSASSSSSSSSSASALPSSSSSPSPSPSPSPFPLPAQIKAVVVPSSASSSSSKAFAVNGAAASKSPEVFAASGAGYGIAYSPYLISQKVKNAAAVKADVQALSKYSTIRLYGTDGNQVANVIAAAKGTGMKIFAGIYDIDDEKAFSESIQQLISQVKNDWNMIETVGVSNEYVNKGGSVEKVQEAANRVKIALRNAGYQGPVVIPDTFVAYLDHPELCQGTDYVAANCHAFFDENTVASEAGSFVKQQVQRIQEKDLCKSKQIKITESGWPSSGLPHGKAIASPESQAAAIKSIKDAFAKNPSDVILFSAFNDSWKRDNVYTHQAERYWGIHGDSTTT